MYEQEHPRTLLPLGVFCLGLEFWVRRAWQGAPGASAPARSPQTSSAGSRAPLRGGLADVTGSSPRAGVLTLGRA